MQEKFDIKAFICSAHRLIEAREGGARISVGEMSARLGVSARTLTEYERGTNQPVGIQAILLMLAQLGDDQIVQMVRKFHANHLRELNEK
jgi:predicted transcriptional regulator